MMKIKNLKINLVKKDRKLKKKKEMFLVSGNAYIFPKVISSLFLFVIKSKFYNQTKYIIRHICSTVHVNLLAPT